MALKEQLKLVSHNRGLLANLIAVKNKSLASWQNENKDLLKEIAETGSALELAEASLRASALEGYKADGNPKPVAGIAIKLFTRLEYLPEVAFQWAKQHDMALSLNTKDFEKLARMQKLDFVIYKEEPQAQISQDLSKVLNDTAIRP